MFEWKVFWLQTDIKFCHSHTPTIHLFAPPSVWSHKVNLAWPLPILFLGEIIAVQSPQFQFLSWEWNHWDPICHVFEEWSDIKCGHLKEENSLLFFYKKFKVNDFEAKYVVE